jgi:hypothetical protein
LCSSPDVVANQTSYTILNVNVIQTFCPILEVVATTFECDASLVLDYDSPYVGEFSRKPKIATIVEFPM